MLMDLFRVLAYFKCGSTERIVTWPCEIQDSARASRQVRIPGCWPGNGTRRVRRRDPFDASVRKESGERFILSSRKVLEFVQQQQQQRYQELLQAGRTVHRCNIESRCVAYGHLPCRVYLESTTYNERHRHGLPFADQKKSQMHRPTMTLGRLRLQRAMMMDASLCPVIH